MRMETWKRKMTHVSTAARVQIQVWVLSLGKDWIADILESIMQGSRLFLFLDELITDVSKYYSDVTEIITFRFIVMLQIFWLKKPSYSHRETAAGNGICWGRPAVQEKKHVNAVETRSKRRQKPLLAGWMSLTETFAKTLPSYCTGRRGDWACSGLVPPRKMHRTWEMSIQLPLKQSWTLTCSASVSLPVLLGWRFFRCSLIVTHTNIKNPQLKWEQIFLVLPGHPEQQDPEWEILETVEHSSLESLKSWLARHTRLAIWIFEKLCCGKKKGFFNFCRASL